MKFFVFSDCHGYFNALKSALDEAGFDPNNDNHWLIGCGDYFDRGRQPQQIIDYLMSIKNKTLIRGNHESLLKEMIVRGQPLSHDYSNGTAETVLDLSNSNKDFVVCCAVAWNKLYQFYEQLVDYFETENYIFVHSFIPLKVLDKLPMYYTIDRKFGAMKNWRTGADFNDWENARWGNPYELAKQKKFLPDKTLVFGHWHTSWPRHNWEGKSEFEQDADFSPYYGNGFIGIDACTGHTGKVNVIVLEDDFIEFQS